ncbi:CAP domain-containing protein [Deinococcus sp. UYEF24]
MPPLLRLLLVLMVLGGPSVTAAPTSPQAQAIAQLMQQTFRQCGQQVAISTPLSLAALDILHHYSQEQALTRQRYRVWKANTFQATYHSDLSWLARNLTNRCGDWTDLTEVGLATDDTQVVIVAARPEAVDLRQTARWLSEFLQLTNRARFQGQKCGGKLMNSTGPLIWDPVLATSGAQYLQDMVRLNFRGHIHAGDGSTPQVRAERAGYQGGVGENLQYNAITPQGAITSLLGSPEHCRNLMDPRYTRFGAAVANGRPDTLFGTYWVQEFGTTK